MPFTLICHICGEYDNTGEVVRKSPYTKKPICKTCHDNRLEMTPDEKYAFNEAIDACISVVRRVDGCDSEGYIESMEAKKLK